MTNKKLIVWSGRIMVKRESCEIIVATQTKKRACELFKISLYYLNTYYSITCGGDALEVALEFPNVVFIDISGSMMGKRYAQLEDLR